MEIVVMLCFQIMATTKNVSQKMEIVVHMEKEWRNENESNWNKNYNFCNLD